MNRKGRLFCAVTVAFCLCTAFSHTVIGNAEETSKSISTISIVTENGVEPTYDVVRAPAHYWGTSIINNEYVNCKIEYIDPNRNRTIIDDSAMIKVRGNTSALEDKKPYKLKLSSKQSFNTNESSKKWVLLKIGTSLNFLFSNWSASYCGVEWQPEFEYVNVTFNGDYRGCYILAESVDNISKSLDFDADGFLIENGAYWWKTDSFFKVSGIPFQLGFTYKEPDAEELSAEQMEAIKEKVTAGSDSIVLDDDREYLNYIDAPNFASWYLTKDYVCGTDTGGSNMYWYSSSKTDLLNLGPTWDYDTDYQGKITSWSGIHTSSNNLGNVLFQKDSFKRIYRNQYEKTKNTPVDLAAYVNQYLDVYGDSLQESWDRDAERWNSQAASVQVQKNNYLDWFVKRNHWIDENTAGWSLDFTQYHSAVEKADQYDEYLYHHYDALDAALHVNVYDVDFTQEELDKVTSDILASISDLELNASADLLDKRGIPYIKNETAYQYDVTVPHVLINQVYGGKNKTAYASNSFIELYNPTDEDVDLTGWSLQYRSSADGDNSASWSKLDLSGTIASHHSYLVQCGKINTPSEGAFVVENPDLTWDQTIHNKGISVVLMADNTLLPDDAKVFDNEKQKPTVLGYVDMLAVSGNDTLNEALIAAQAAPFFEKKASQVQSKKSTIRRIAFKDTDNNTVGADFEEVDYSFTGKGYSDYIRPRSGSDGAWTAEQNPKPIYTVTLLTDGGSVIDTLRVSASQKLSQIRELQKTGYTFTGWFTDENCTVPCVLPFKPTDDMSLYAGWSRNTYTKMGDVTLDDTVDARDAASILEYAAAKGAGETPSLVSAEDAAIEEMALRNADVDGSGTIDAIDAADVLLYAAITGAEGSADWDEILHTKSEPTESIS